MSLCVSRGSRIEFRMGSALEKNGDTARGRESKELERRRKRENERERGEKRENPTFTEFGPELSYDIFH